MFTVDITITNPDGKQATATAAFTFDDPAPTITGVSPSHGVPGDVVTISGTGFVPGLVVLFGGKPASVLGMNATQLTCAVPV